MSNERINDFISGNLVLAKPEEVHATQPFSKMLVNDYNYPKSHIQTRPQFRVRARPSDQNRSYPVDIAVFKSEQKLEDDVSIIVECKNPNETADTVQLRDYLKFSNARLGVWFNGNEIVCIQKVESDGYIEFESIPTLPKYGQRIEDIGRFKRKDLEPTHNLKTVFKAIRNHLAGNAVGVTRDETIAQQLINVIFCKIYDEKYTSPDDMVTFRYGVREDEIEVERRILSLFDSVKSVYSEVLNEDDVIDLDANSLAYVVGKLQNYCLLEAERDVIADAFEYFIGSALKGEQGQFFTPRNVSKLMIEILDPNAHERIIDPACGTGGFLIESLKFVWERKIQPNGQVLGWPQNIIENEKQKFATKNIFGIDKDKILSKVTKAYMTLMGDGTVGVVCDDSLEKESNWNAITRQNIELGKFDIVVTNPPFGSKIAVTGKDKLSQFDLAHNWKLQNNIGKRGKLKAKEKPQVLFIERCLELLKDGGRLAIILPETYFHAPNSKYLRDYIRHGNNILWVIDLPHNTFKPYCNAKTIVIVLEKNKIQSSVVNMAFAEEIGHNHQGKELLRQSELNSNHPIGSLWDDLEVISTELRNPADKSNHFTISQELSKMNTDVLVPRYYLGRRNLPNESADFIYISVGELLEQEIIDAWDGHGSPPAIEKGQGEVPYIRVSDIVNWELYRNPTTGVREEVWEEFTANKLPPEQEDIIFVRRGSYRIGTVAMVSPRDTKLIFTRELLTIRVMNQANSYGITPYYLLALLSSKSVYEQCANLTFMDTTLPNIGNRWTELRLEISQNPMERLKIHNAVKSALDQKWAAQNTIDALRKTMNELIT